MLMNFILLVLGMGCAFLTAGLLLDRLLNRPIERRWR